MSRLGSRRFGGAMRRPSGVAVGGSVAAALPTADLLLAFDARVGVTTSSGEVTDWEDQSGNGFDAAQATPGDRPTYEATGGPGSTPRIAFGAQATGTSGYLTLPTSIKASSGPIEAWVVGNLNSAPTSSHVFDTITGRALLSASRTGLPACYDSGYQTFGSTVLGAQTLNWRLQSSGSEIRRNGSVLTPTSTSTWAESAVGGTTSLGATGAGAGHFDGWMAAFFLFGAISDASKRAAIEAYIAANFPGYGL